MPPLQGLAYFPGINQLVSASLSFVHGISPSVAVLTIAPQGNFAAQGGTLQFNFGTTTINLPGCKVDTNSFERTSSGEIWRLSIYDRRWRWAYGQISGSYNLRNDDGSLRTDTEKTPQELLTLCLEAMGEAAYDVSNAPNSARPTVEWDFDVPAESLAMLCDELGCRVVLGFDDIVRVCRIGIGATLPADSILENWLSFDSAERPDALSVVCGRDRYQADFELEAVGRDIDGQIKLIDSLSYKPSAGWQKVDLPHFASVTTSAAARDLAKATVFRWYRIKTPLQLPDFGEVAKLEQILPIESQQIETVVENGVKRPKPASVHGVWFTELDDYKNSTDKLRPGLDSTPDGQGGTRVSALYERRYEIDTDLGIVKFEHYVYRNTATSAATPVVLGEAQLRLRTAVGARDVQQRSWTRHARTRNLGSGFGTQPRFLRHEELTLTHIQKYDATSYAVAEITRNDAEVDQQADSYLDAAEQEYQASVPQSIKYAGLRAIEPDGAIEHVILEVGPSGATTTAVRHNELLLVTVGHRERRSIERTRQLPALMAATKPAAVKRQRRAI